MTSSTGKVMFVSPPALFVKVQNQGIEARRKCEDMIAKQS